MTQNVVKDGEFSSLFTISSVSLLLMKSESRIVLAASATHELEKASGMSMSSAMTRFFSSAVTCGLLFNNSLEKEVN